MQDDAVLITGNARIHELANWQAIVGSPFWPPPYSEDLYRPLTALLLAVEWALGGGSPVVFRIVSYLLYAAAAVAVLGLGRRLLPLPIAVGAALLFAAHPVHVEAVALGVGQNELLVGLLACVATGLYVSRRGTEAGLRPRDWLALGALYLAASLLKEGGLVIPGLLLAAELILPGSRSSRRWRALAPGYAFLAVIGVLVLLARAAVLRGDLAGTFTADALYGLSTGGRLLTMLRVVPEWLRLLVWPAELQADYSPQELVASTGFGAAEAIGLLVLLGGAATAWLMRARAPVISFGLAWTAISLFPVSNVLVPTGIVLAERTLFLPSVGFLLALAAVGTVGTLRSVRTLKPVGAVLLALLVVAGVLRSAERQRVWRDETVLRLRGVEDAPNSWRTQLSYGTAMFEQGQAERALEAYERSLRLAPPQLRFRVRNDLAQRFLAAGENELAVEQLRASVASAPGIEETRHYLVLGLLALGDYSAASAEADSALARGFSAQLFGELRGVAEAAARDRAPPGSIKIRIRR